ncbi:hypothetical protein B0H15DRAFT_951273 [Mycena belliarum]|uniref:Uncharacterized protein n=1 Tax=Mycena belliarum TaxID=1033014 RepID=A0AAD6U4R0_9AGAR|nr:hypothetical protein B0H15DRAFT_951273 [Mycena belliae]
MPDPSSAKNKSRKRGDTESDLARAPKKRGNQGDFHGQREAFLRDRLPSYIEASEKQTTRSFWPELMFDYWKRFPWYLSLDEDSNNDTVPDETLDIDLSDADREKKRDILTKMEAKIKAWFNYQRGHSGRNGTPKNPWLPLLAGLRHSDELQPPKRLADFQVYMQQDGVKEKINKVFAERHPGHESSRGTINLRTAIAREMLTKAGAEERNRMHILGGELHATALAKYNAEKEWKVDLTEAEMEGARERFAPIVAPLLRLLSDTTGYHVGLIFGRVDEAGKFDVRSMHEGKTKAVPPQDWPGWAGKAYNDTVLQQCDAARIPGDFREPEASAGTRAAL